MATILRGSDNFDSTDILNYIPIAASYHLLGGNLSVDTTVLTNGFGTTLYTGNGATQSINTDVDMATQWGNDASETFGGLVWLKSRSNAYDHGLIDTIRGGASYLASHSTAIAGTTSPAVITSFNNNGFTFGTTGYTMSNANLATYASWNFQTTHRRTGVTNHGKAYTEHYNPFTGFTIIKYEGSGIAGHEIPHSLGRKLGFWLNKNLTAVTAWNAQYRENYNLNMDTAAEGAISIVGTNNSETSLTIGTGALVNTSTNQYIMYGWANSYYDETNKLIGNYEVGVYQGTGIAGNKVKTKGKPAWVMAKRLDSTGNWWIIDNKRPTTNGLYANTSDLEANRDGMYFVEDGFKFTDLNINENGSQYLYMVVYDNDSGSGKSKYHRATDTSNVQINNALIPLAHGIDNKGNKNNIVIANETITGVTYTDGKNYLYKTDTGYGVKPYEPRYLSSELVRRFAGEQPDYYDVDKNKWFNTSEQGELVTNGTGLSLTGWTGNDVNSGFPNSTLSLSNQTIVITNSSTAGSNGGAYQLLTGLTAGKKYKVKLSQDGTVVVQVGTTSHLANVRYDYSSAGATEFEFIAQATNIYLTFYNSVSTANDSCWIDNVTCFATEITPTTEITNSRNYLNHIVHADNDGGVLYVEELPKVEYKDIVKANEFKGKNACTAWVNFDGATTPPTIRDSYNVSAVIRTATGHWEIYFIEEMLNTNYVTNFTAKYYGGTGGFYSDAGNKSTKKVTISCINQAMTTGFNNDMCNVHIIGGKN